MENQLKIIRITALFYRYWILNKNFLMTGMASVFGAVLLITLIAINSSGYYDINVLKFLFLVAMFIFGAIFTSNVFKEMHHPAKSYTFLTLPVSNSERLISAWIFSSLFVVTGFIIITGIASLLANVFSVVFFDNSFVAFDLYDRGFFVAMATFITIQPVFMLGAAQFKSHQFFKTLLSAFIVIGIIAMFSVIITSVLFKGAIVSMDLRQDFAIGTINFMANTFPIIIKWMYWVLVGPFFLVVTFFKLKEKQI
jgi:hypothetical protein